MANFAYVENNTVVGVYDYLPAVWRNISNFNALANNLVHLATLGWFPVKQTEYNYTYGLQRLENRRIEIVNGEVVETWDVVDIPVVVETPPETPVQPPLSPEEAYNVFMETLRTERNSKLTASDWTQLYDIVNSKSQEWVTAWANYRQALRDLPAQYVYDSNTIYDINNVIWPSEPVV